MKKIQKFVMALLAGMAVCSCTQLEVVLPRGPQGEQGIPGLDGLSAYEVWVQSIKNRIISYAGGTEINDFFIYLKGKDGKDGRKGEDGKDGTDGKDGLTPFIGEDGNWHLGDLNTGVPARGKDGLIPQVRTERMGSLNGSLSGDRRTPSGSAYRLWERTAKTACRLMRSGLRVSPPASMTRSVPGSVGRWTRRRLRTFTTF